MKKGDSKIINLFKNNYFYYGVFVLVIGIAINQVNSWYIKTKYSELPLLNDILLDNLPYFNLVWVFDLLAIVSIIFFIYYAYKKDFEKIPYFLTLFGISQLVRGVFIGFTPFGSPKLDHGILNTGMFRAGIYPSGHTGFSFLAFLLSKGIYRIIFLFLSMGIMITLILARGHYSVDIFSAIIFNYAIFEFGNRFLRKHYFKEKTKA